MATGITKNLDLEFVLIEGAGALMKSVAGAQGIGVGLDDDFVEHVGRIAAALNEEHAHGIDVEVDGPDERKIGIKLDRLQMERAIKRVIDAIGASGSEDGFEFLAERFLIQIGGGGGDLIGGHVAALRSSELEGRPFGIGLRAQIEIVKVIAALGRAEKEGAALAISERGTDNFGPDVGLHGSEFVHDGKIETVATDGIGTVGATERDGAIRI